MREPRFLSLSVVIPIASASCEAAWLEDDACADDTRNDSMVVDAHEDSECTEEEKVAVEQLQELRRIRDLSMQEDANDGSCSTEGSFNRKLPSLSGAPPHTCINRGGPSPSPATSSSAACGIEVWNLKHMHEQQESKLKQDVQHCYDEDNMQVPTSKHVTTFSDCDLKSDNDGRLKPRRRLLSDIYGDDSNESSMFLQPIKARKKRRKAINKIMAVGQPYVPAALAGHSTHGCT